MISRVFDLHRQFFIVVKRTCTFGIGIAISIGVDIETDCDCDPDTDPDPDNAVRATSSVSHNQAPNSAGGYYYFNGKRETGNGSEAGSISKPTATAIPIPIPTPIMLFVHIERLT